MHMYTCYDYDDDNNSFPVLVTASYAPFAIVAGLLRVLLFDFSASSLF
jgi:hypothetical protein